MLKDVIVLPRMAVRQLDRIFLIDPNELTLEGHTIEPLWSDEDCLVVRNPSITDGAMLATTHLIYAPDDSKVEILPDPNDVTEDTAEPNEQTQGGQ